MKGILLLSVLWFVGVAAGQDTLTFTNKLATFTNLQGQVYRDVQLVRADAYSIIYRETVGGGSVCLTNLPVAFLESLGISSNQITVAKAGADRRAAGDAAYRQSLQSQAAQAALVLSTYIPTNRLDGRP